MKVANKITILVLLLVSTSSFSMGQHEFHWSYTGNTDASHWGDISVDFIACKFGREQSPVDIKTQNTVRVKFDPIIVNYIPGPVEVFNNGHTIQVNLQEGSSITVGGKKFKLLQVHFHAPSEEKINGKNFPLGVHFVHKNAQGEFAVFGVFVKEGKENAILKSIFDNMPLVIGGKVKIENFAINRILPDSWGYYHLVGSLTTPPCTEGVVWKIFKEPIEVSAEQINQFRKIYQANARPVQPLNGRIIKVSD